MAKPRTICDISFLLLKKQNFKGYQARIKNRNTCQKIKDYVSLVISNYYSKFNMLLAKNSILVTSSHSRDIVVSFSWISLGTPRHVRPHPVEMLELTCNFYEYITTSKTTTLYLGSFSRLN